MTLLSLKPSYCSLFLWNKISSHCPSGPYKICPSSCLSALITCHSHPHLLSYSHTSFLSYSSDKPCILPDISNNASSERTFLTDTISSLSSSVIVSHLFALLQPLLPTCCGPLSSANGLAPEGLCHHLLCPRQSGLHLGTISMGQKLGVRQKERGEGEGGRLSLESLSVSTSLW